MIELRLTAAGIPAGSSAGGAEVPVYTRGNHPRLNLLGPHARASAPSYEKQQRSSLGSRLAGLRLLRQREEASRALLIAGSSRDSSSITRPRFTFDLRFAHSISVAHKACPSDAQFLIETPARRRTVRERARQPIAALPCLIYWAGRKLLSRPGCSNKPTAAALVRDFLLKKQTTARRP